MQARGSQSLSEATKPADRTEPKNPSADAREPHGGLRRGGEEAYELAEAIIKRLNTERNVARGPFSALALQPLHVHRKAWEEERRESAAAVDDVYHASTDVERVRALKHLETEIGDVGAYLCAALCEARRMRREIEGEGA